MKTYGSSVRVISGRGRLALALMAAIVVALLPGLGQPGGERALATGDGAVTGKVIVVIGGISLTCPMTGHLIGSSELDPGTLDVSFVTDALDGSGQCVGSLPFTMTGGVTGEITELVNLIPNELEFPAVGTFEVFLNIDSDLLGPDVHNIVPMMMDCPEITDPKRFPCNLTPATSVALWNPGETTILATITDVDLVFEGLDVGGIAELAEAAGSPLETPDASSTSAGLIAGVLAAVAAGVVALGGAAWYARKIWLRRPS